MNESTELCSRLFIVWNFESNAGAAMNIDAEYNSSSFIAKIIRKKMEVFNVPVKIPDSLLCIIELCSECNPGIAQVMLKEILSNIPNLTPGYEIKPVDFSRVYSFEFPIIEGSQKWEKHFSDLWDAQKRNGINMCDTVNWWMEPFQEA